MYDKCSFQSYSYSPFAPATKTSGHVAVVLNAVPRLPPECPNSLDEVKVKKL